MMEYGSGVTDLKTEQEYLGRMLDIGATRKIQDKSIMELLKPTKEKGARKKKGKGTITLTALKSSPHQVWFMEHNIVTVNVKNRSNF